ncbi:unnamed protein product [Nesidiocoris tenuis]|uniref:RING-type domain-containing protein n=1 Tax=Nesidiocoris tenuis TaxID=355587 RepID=A0A6H5HMU6_9HEMI|nr:unnamed protein product [Nesidiocoris tenuis]
MDDPLVPNIAPMFMVNVDSMTTPFAICNFRSCETPLLKIGWITACSHAYCDEHGENFFQNSAAFVGCPSCGRNLNLDTEVVRNDLDPPDFSDNPPLDFMFDTPSAVMVIVAAGQYSFDAGVPIQGHAVFLLSLEHRTMVNCDNRRRSAGRISIHC